jgi:dTDP-4-dehydrorhamnose 3,5-epimerase
MKCSTTSLPGVLVIEPQVFGDARGRVWEAWHEPRYRDAGITTRFVQDSVSVSRQNVIRGLHYQHPFSQGKLISVLSGEIFDVAVDVRRGSPTFGRWVSTMLSADSARQLFVPEGFAHGFAVLSEQAVVLYRCSAFYHPEHEHTIRWDDPAIGVTWPITDPLLSSKDHAGMLLSSIPSEQLPVWIHEP